MSKMQTPVALAFATNMHGKLKPSTVKRIERYLNNPSFDNWDDVAHIIIDGSGRMKTIWNAVLEVDPMFPRRGRSEDRAGNVVREWEYFPDTDVVVKAITKTCMAPLLAPTS